MSNTDLMETDLMVLAHTIALAFGGERQTALEKEIGRLLIRAEDNAAKRHARMMRGPSVKGAFATERGPQMEIFDPGRLPKEVEATIGLLLNLDRHCRTHMIFERFGSWIQVMDLRLTRAE